MDLHQNGLTGSPRMVESFRRDKRDILYTLSTIHGQSGAPILLIRKDNPPVIIGIHKGSVHVNDKGQKQLYNCGKHLDFELRVELRKQVKKIGGIPFKSKEISLWLDEGEKLMLQKNWKVAE